jgi:hypothetical protein
VRNSQRLAETYGADAVRLISENPYRLARDIRGIGFRTANQIAAKLGVEKTALIRVRAGISYTLAEAMDEGHAVFRAKSSSPSPKSCSKCRPNWSKRRCTSSSRVVQSSPARLKRRSIETLTFYKEPCIGCRASIVRISIDHILERLSEEIKRPTHVRIFPQWRELLITQGQFCRA